MRDPLRARTAASRGPISASRFKNAVKELAHLHGYCATFMAKPFAGLAGSGNHTHVSLLDGDGRNVFGDDTDASTASRTSAGVHRGAA